MALYRCAACGSANVVIDTQTGGMSYNYKKGIVGTAILGVGGAVAGVENKTEKVYKCSDCGITLSYPMDDGLKNVIDLCLLNGAVRDKIEYEGMPVNWSYIKQKYKNIETTEVDRVIEKKKLVLKKRRLSNLERFEADGGDCIWCDKKGKQLRPLFDSKCKECKETVKKHNQENVEVAKTSLLNAKKNIDELKNKIKELKNQEDTLNSKIDIKKNYLNSLSFFKRKEKNEILQEIDSLDREVISILERIDKTNNKINAEYKKIEEAQKLVSDELPLEMVKDLVMYAVSYLGTVSPVAFFWRLGFDLSNEEDEKKLPFSENQCQNAFKELAKEKKLLKIIRKRKTYYAFPNPVKYKFDSDMVINLDE